MTFDSVKWTALVHREREWRQRMIEANSYVGQLVDVEPARQWWQCAASMLLMYSLEQGTGSALPEFPEGLIQMLQVVAAHFATGNVTDFVDMVVASNAPNAPPMKAECIGWATLYLRAVQAGEIADKTPTKTIVDAYGVSSPAVQKWGKMDVPEGLMFLTALHRPDRLKEKIKSSGDYYRSHYSMKHRSVPKKA